MKYRYAILNAISFGIIFGFLTSISTQIGSNILFVSSVYINSLIWALVGFMIVILIHYVADFHKRAPSHVNSNLVMLPTALLLILFLFLGYLFFNGSSNTSVNSYVIDETIYSQNSEEDLFEESIEEDSSEKSGICQEHKLVSSYHEEAESYYHEEIWEDIHPPESNNSYYRCNLIEDCFDKLPDYDQSKLRCNVLE